MDYVGTDLHVEIAINKIYSIHYFEYMSDYSFEGESHDFWELVYVDKGEVDVVADDEMYTCMRGEIIFHQPNEFHALKANGVSAPNLVVVSFECLSEAMDLFRNEKMNVSANEKKILSQIILEARHAFNSPLDKTYLYQLERNDKQVFGSEQLIALHLQHLLLSLLRRKEEQSHTGQMISKVGEVMTKENYDEFIYQRVIKYMQDQIKEFLTLEEICKAVLVSRTKLQNMFNVRHKCGVMHYFIYLKIELSKQLMREDNMNFTGIADYLGYTSIHYFSRQFKKMTNMTPSEYVSSVKGMSENK